MCLRNYDSSATFPLSRERCPVQLQITTMIEVWTDPVLISIHFDDFTSQFFRLYQTLEIVFHQLSKHTEFPKILRFASYFLDETLSLVFYLLRHCVSLTDTWFRPYYTFSFTQ